MTDQVTMEQDSTAASSPLAKRLTELRQAGVHRFDPVQFQYLESLCQRLADAGRLPTAGQQQRIEQTLKDLWARFDQAKADAERLAEKQTEAQAHDTETLSLTPPLTPWQTLLEAGDVREIARQAKRQRHQRPASPLAELTATLQANAPASCTEQSASPLDTLIQQSNLSLAGHGTAGRELKALSGLREAQEYQALEQRIAEAIEQTPADAGPMNPHRLVTRAVKQMQQLSPAYLHRFAHYVDTLMTLEKLGRKG